MWETFTRQLIPTEKWDCIPRNPPLQFRHERQFPEVEAGFASADCRGEPARAAGALAAPARAAMHPWRNDVSRAGSAVARTLRQCCRARLCLGGKGADRQSRESA